MDTVGGYRLIRRLGSGQRAEIHLGHAGTREPPDLDRVAAIKLYRPTTPDTEIDAEIETLSRLRSPHLLELTDLSTDQYGRPCLILPRLGSGSLGRLLAVRSSITAGEAVTLLVPLIESVAQLHRVGVAHGAIGPGSVLFDTRGAPILARFGCATIVGAPPAGADSSSLTPAELDACSEIRVDRRGLAELSRVVLDRIVREETSSVRSELNRVLGVTVADGVPDFDTIVDLLFELAPARPVRFEDAPLTATEANLVGSGSTGGSDGMEGRDFSVIPARFASGISDTSTGLEPDEQIHGVQRTGRRKHRLRTRGSLRPPSRAGGTPHAPKRSSVGGWPSGEKLSALARRMMGGDVDRNPFTILWQRAIHSLAPVRKPVWIAGGAGIGALVIAFSIFPAAHSVELDQKPVVVHTDVAKNSASKVSESAPAKSTSAKSAGAASSDDSTGRASDASAISGDDPIAAANALVSVRKTCFLQRKAACLGGVDQTDSAALESDLHLLRALRRGVDLPDAASLDGWQPHLVQQLGNSAIFELRAFDGTGSATQQGAPTPFLLVREEAGWRIRDVTLG